MRRDRFPMPAVVLGVALACAAPLARQANPFLGVWNIAGTGPDTAVIMWLEVTEQDGQLRGLFLNRTGNPAPLPAIAIEGGELVFRAGAAEHRARIDNGRLVGRYTVTQGGRRGAPADPSAPAPVERVVNWVGIRPPVWQTANANATHAYGAPVSLFDGRSLDQWTVQFPNRPFGWRIEDGLLTNAPPPDATGPRPPGNNLVSKEKFFNFKLEAEYKLAPTSNSGIYLRGRYELQILDDINGTGRPDLGHMAIYGRTPPLVKASRAAGEWQTMEAVLVQNRVTVTLNGQRVHDNAVVLGVTGGTLDNDELVPGPIMVQGDHGDIWIRKLVVTPINDLGSRFAFK